MPPQSTISELFRNNRSYRCLFGARIVSLFGDWFNTLAVLALLRELGGLSASSFAFVIIFKTLPTLFVSPLAGVAADRYSRRSIMIASDLLRFFVVLGMLALMFFPSSAGLYSLIVAQACLATFFDPARSALIPDVVSPEELVSANAVDAASWSAMLTLGAGLGGLVTAAFGWQSALAIDALSYLVSAGFLLSFEEPAWERSAGKGEPGLLNLLGINDMKVGLEYVLARPRIATLLLVKTGWCLAGSITLVLTELGERVFPIGGSAMLGVALLYTARGLGTGLGPIVSRLIAAGNEERMERFILYGYLCGAFFYVLLAPVTHPALAAPLVLCAHVGGATCWVFSIVRLQQLVPTSVRGRVLAVDQALFTTMIAATTFLVGLLIDSKLISLSGVVSLTGLVLLIPAAGWALRGRVLGFGGAIAREEAALSLPAAIR